MGNVKEHILFLDIGNSFIKAAYKLDDSDWVKESIRFSNEAELVHWLQDQQSGFTMCVLSSVVNRELYAIRDFFGDKKIINLSVSRVPADKLDYETPQTLGIDRVLACLGAYQKSNKGVIAIDAGTACTIDYMNAEGVFTGGVIMPGLGIIKQALIDHAPALPIVDERIPATWPGKSTYASIQWGTSGIVKDAIEAQIRRYLFDDPTAEVHITGGDASHIQNLIEVDALVDPMLVFQGMDYFLELFID